MYSVDGLTTEIIRDMIGDWLALPSGKGIVQCIDNTKLRVEGYGGPTRAAREDRGPRGPGSRPNADRPLLATAEGQEVASAHERCQPLPP